MYMSGKKRKTTIKGRQRREREGRRGRKEEKKEEKTRENTSGMTFRGGSC